MFLPLTTEHEATCKPIANLAIIVLTLVVSWSLFRHGSYMPFLTEGRLSFVLIREGFRPEQLIGHLLAHADRTHLIGNMALLLAIGNSVNRRLGNLRYLCLYFVTGVLAGLGWMQFGSHPGLIGASGAVLGVFTAFLVLFPTTRIKALFSWLGLGAIALSLLWLALGLKVGLVFLVGLCLIYFGGLVFCVKRSMAYSGSAANVALAFLGLRVVHLTGVWLVVATLGLDVLYLLSSVSDGVAHVAHLAGGCAGFAITVGLCMTKGVRGTRYAPTLVELAGWAEPREEVVEPRVAPTPTSASGRSPYLRGRLSTRRLKTFEQWAGETARTRLVRRKTRRVRHPSAAA
ncbi:MAG: rhomboid family intramembrane serine protease [Planctomycetes bacterium]|nr:rhomboid family intramembrane serine protease [Planctomycetota bacterium]